MSPLLEDKEEHSTITVLRILTRLKREEVQDSLENIAYFQAKLVDLTDPIEIEAYKQQIEKERSYLIAQRVNDAF